MSELIKGNEAQLPAFMQEIESDDSANLAKDHKRVQYMRVVQNLGALADKYDKGTVLLMPSEKVLETPRRVVPIFTYKSWGVYYDVNRGKPNPCKEYTLDPDHIIAKRATDWRNRDNQTEVDPEDSNFNLTYMETIIVAAWDLDLQDIVMYTFRSGEHKTGRAWLGMMSDLKIRGKVAPIYCGVYKVTTETHQAKSNANQKWQGFRFDPDGYPESMEEVNQYKEMYQNFKNLHESAELGAGDEDTSTDGEDTDAPSF